MSAPSGVDVQVGIGSWNVSGLLDQCLAALPAALSPLRARVVVVDNASSDDSVEVAQRHPHVEVIANPDNVGYARGMNQALAGSDAPVLIALNPDTVPPPGSLAALVQALHADAGVALVAPRLVNIDGSTQHSVYRFPSPAVTAAASLPRRCQQGRIGRRWWLEGASPHDRSTDIDWAIGAVHVIRAAALDGEPPYSERWFMYVEDLELCWRLERAGWRCRLEAEVDVPHVGNASGAQAWGDTRTAVWLRGTYDWYVMARGRWAARRWGVTAVAGLVWLVAARGIVAVARPDRRRRARAEARDFAKLLRLHLGFIWSLPTEG